MESQAKYTLVGAFVLAGTVLFIGFLLWLTNASGRQTDEMYIAYFRSQSLDGLQEGSSVTMKGITVGKVESYQVSPKNIEEVKVLLRLDQDTPVKVDTRVIVQRNLLTGFATLGLVGSTQESAPLFAAPRGEDYPVILEGQSQLERIADTIPELVDRVEEMVGRVSLVLSNENIKSFSATLKHVEETAEAVASKKEQLTASLESIEEVASDISSLSRSLKSFTKKAESNLDSLGGETARVLEEIRVAAESFNTRATEMRDAVKSASQVFSQEITSMAQSVGNAADSLSSTVEGFEDPKKIITGPSQGALGPGESFKR